MTTLVISVGLAGCGDGDDASTSPPSDIAESPAASPANEPLTPADTDVVTVDSSSTIPSGSTAAEDPDREVAPSDARSIVDVWQLESLHMSSRFVHYYEPPRADDSGQGVLLYYTHDRAGQVVQLEWPYDGSAVRYDYEHLSVAPSYVVFQDESANRQWRATAGSVSLVPVANGRVRVELAGLEIVETLADGEGPPAPIEDGFVEGDVERVCIEYVVTPDAPINGETGQPQPQPQRDDDWSSPFCAQHAP